MKLCYKTTQLFGYSGRAIHVMRFVSALATSGILCLFFLFCYRRFSLRPVSSLLATAVLAFTYGFWRYSAESEIPLTASVFMVAALYYSTDSDIRKRAFGFAVLFSVLSVLMHIMNAVAVFVAIPCFYLLRKRWKVAGLHLLLTGGLVASIYSLIAQYGTIYSSGGAHYTSLDPRSFIKGAVAFVECLISCDFMLGFASVREFLGELFAGRMLQEEFYFGARLPQFHVLLSAMSFAAFMVLFIACIARAAWVWKNIARDKKRFILPDGISSLVVAGIFFLGYAALLLLIEPGNPELWVMGLVPFSLLFCGMVLLPLTYDNRLWLPFFMILSLLIHNAGAIRMLYDADKDYQQQKARVILEIANEDDVIITAANPVFERYLRYHFKGKVCYLHAWDSEQFFSEAIPVSKGKIYVLDDVFNQPPSLRIRFPEKTGQITVFAEQLRPKSEYVADDGFGGAWEFHREVKSQL